MNLALCWMVLEEIKSGDTVQLSLGSSCFERKREQRRACLPGMNSKQLSLSLPVCGARSASSQHQGSKRLREGDGKCC